MIATNTIPRALLTLITEHQHFLATTDSILNLWNDVVEKNEFSQFDEEILNNWYSTSFRKLDTYEASILVDAISKAVTRYNTWPINNDGVAHHQKFIEEYRTVLETNYNFRNH